MNTVTTIKETLSKSKDLAGVYASQELEHLQLKLFYKLAAHASGTTKKVVLGILFLLGMTFGSVALALYLGEYFNNLSAGFLTVAGIYLILVVIAFFLRKYIEKYIINELARNYFNA